MTRGESKLKKGKGWVTIINATGKVHKISKEKPNSNFFDESAVSFIPITWKEIRKTNKARSKTTKHKHKHRKVKEE